MGSGLPGTTEELLFRKTRLSALTKSSGLDPEPVAPVSSVSVRFDRLDATSTSSVAMVRRTVQSPAIGKIHVEVYRRNKDF